MAALTMKELLEAGVHFGPDQRWNPKMQKYIFGERNGIYIIDLQKTLKKFREAYGFVRDLAAGGHRALHRHQEAGPGDRVRGGESLRDVLRQPALAGWYADELRDDPQVDQSPAEARGDEGNGRVRAAAKKEANSTASGRKLEKALVGIKLMEQLPAAVFIIDPRKEKIAVAEAQRLGISIVAIVDTCDPTGIDYPVPGNDDAIRAVRLITSRIADAVNEGRGTLSKDEAETATADAGRRRRDGGGRGGESSRGLDRAAGEGATRSDGRRRDGLQGGPDGERGGSAGRRRVPEKEGAGASGQAGSPGRARGVVGTYVHPGAKLGVLVEVNCETDWPGPRRSRSSSKIWACRSPPRIPRTSPGRTFRVRSSRRSARSIATRLADQKKPSGHRQDHRGQAGQVLHRAVPARAALHQGRDRQDPSPRSRRRRECQDRGADRGQAVRPVPGGRGGVDDGAAGSGRPVYRRIVLKLSGKRSPALRATASIRPCSIGSPPRCATSSVSGSSSRSSSAAATSSAGSPPAPPGWTAPPPTTWACWRRSSTRWPCRTLEKSGLHTRVLSAIEMRAVADRRVRRRHPSSGEGRIVDLRAGTEAVLHDRHGGRCARWRSAPTRS